MRERGQAFLFIQEYQLPSQLPSAFLREPAGFACGYFHFALEISPLVRLDDAALMISGKKKHFGLAE